MRDSSDKPMATDVPSGIKRWMASDKESNLELGNIGQTSFAINNGYRVIKVIYIRISDLFRISDFVLRIYQFHRVKSSLICI